MYIWTGINRHRARGFGNYILGLEQCFGGISLLRIWAICIMADCLADKSNSICQTCQFNIALVDLSLFECTTFLKDTRDGPKRIERLQIFWLKQKKSMVEEQGIIAVQLKFRNQVSLTASLFSNPYRWTFHYASNWIRDTDVRRASTLT